MNHINNMNARKRSYETHSLDQASHAYPAVMGAPTTAYQWHEMDYTSSAMDTPRFAPTSAPVQYSSSGMMSFSPVDYTRHEFSYANPYSENDVPASVQPSNLFRVGPFRYADLANIDGDTASISQESIYSRGTRLHSLTDSERRDSQANSILSSNDVRRGSEGYERIFPTASIEPESCSSDPSSRDAPCIDMTNLTPIEECASAPCKDHESSPIRTTHSGFSSPTTLTFQEPTTTENSKVLKPRRMPRSKSANSGITDGTALEKASKLRARQAHSLVERKYRDNLNLKISQLHQTLQNARCGSSSILQSPQNEVKADYFDEEVVVSPEIPNEKSSTGSTPTGPKVRKSDVLTEAMNYVNATEVEMRHMSEEIMRLNARVKTLEKLIRCEDCTLLKSMVTLQVEGQQVCPKH